MATGDANDIAARLGSLLPSSWFADSAPVLNAVLLGCATPLAAVYSLIAYAGLQTRIGTASDVFLDIISADYFGLSLPRRTLETDAAFRARIKLNLFVPRVTRAAMIWVLTNLTGRAPTIFEPAQTGDTGGYNTGVFAYGAAGGYGSYAMPFTAFINAKRPAGGGVANVMGFYQGSGHAVGGYGAGAIAYIAQGQTNAPVSDADIYAAVDATKPAGSTMWVSISS